MISHIGEKLFYGQEPIYPWPGISDVLEIVILGQSGTGRKTFQKKNYELWKFFFQFIIGNSGRKILPISLHVKEHGKTILPIP